MALSVITKGVKRPSSYGQKRYVIPRQPTANFHETVAFFSKLARGYFQDSRKLFNFYSVEVLSEQIHLYFTHHLDEVIDEFMVKNHPIWWENIPNLAKTLLKKQVENALPLLIDDFLDHLLGCAHEILSFEQIITYRLREDLHLLKISVDYLQTPDSAGNPTEQYKIHVFLITHFLMPEHVLRSLFQGTSSSSARHMIYQKVKPFLESPAIRITLQISLGTYGYLHLKNQLTDTLIACLNQPQLFASIKSYMIEHLRVQSLAKR